MVLRPEFSQVSCLFLKGDPPVTCLLSLELVTQTLIYGDHLAKEENSIRIRKSSTFFLHAVECAYAPPWHRFLTIFESGEGPIEFTESLK